MLPDPRTVDYAFVGMDWLGLLAGLAITAAIALTARSFFEKRGHSGAALHRLALSATLPLAAAAFVLRTLVAFAVAAAAHMLEPADGTALVMGSAVEVAFLLAALGLVGGVLASSGEFRSWLAR